MIRSFRCADTETLAKGWEVPRFQAFERVARRKLLRGDRAGQYSIRINDQFRLCFCWSDSGPEDVEIVDYH
jgi:proteic killer suppression protein